MGVLLLITKIVEITKTAKTMINHFELFDDFGYFGFCNFCNFSNFDNFGIISNRLVGPCLGISRFITNQSQSIRQTQDMIARCKYSNYKL